MVENNFFSKPYPGFSSDFLLQPGGVGPGSVTWPSLHEYVIEGLQIILKLTVVQGSKSKETGGNEKPYIQVKQGSI